MKKLLSLALHLFVLTLPSGRCFAVQCSYLLRAETSLQITRLTTPTAYGDLMGDNLFERALIKALQKIRRKGASVDIDVVDLRVLYQIDDTYVNRPVPTSFTGQHYSPAPLYDSWIHFMNSRDMSSDLAKIFSVNPQEVRINTTFKNKDNSSLLKVYYGPYNQSLKLYRGAFIDTSELLYVVGSLDVSGPHNLSNLRYIRDGLNLNTHLSVETPSFVESRDFKLGGVVIGDVIFLEAFNSRLRFRYGYWGNIGFNSFTELSAKINDCTNCVPNYEGQQLIE